MEQEADSRNGFALKSVVAVTVGAVCVLALGVAAYFSIRLAQADTALREGTPEAVARALALQPMDTRYLSQRALQVEYDGGDPAPLLEQWAKLNPLGSAPRIRLGLLAEGRGDLAGAEKWLLDAARVDHQYEPRWTLANFYFRNGDKGANEVFWKWVKLALEVSYGDRRPAFELCWRVAGEGPGRVQRILGSAIPDRRDVAATFLQFVLYHEPESAGPAALNLAGLPGHNPYMALLGGAMDALIDRGRPDDALTVWRKLGRPDPLGVRDTEFRSAMTQDPLAGYAFHWREVRPQGIRHLPLEPNGHRILFSGKEPDTSELLKLTFLVKPERAYELRWGGSEDALKPNGGVTAEVRAGSMADGKLLAAAPLGSNHLSFQMSSHSRVPQGEFVTFRIRYERPVGQVRAEGAIEVRTVELADTGAAEAVR